LTICPGDDAPSSSVIRTVAASGPNGGGAHRQHIRINGSTAQIRIRGLRLQLLKTLQQHLKTMCLALLIR